MEFHFVDYVLGVGRERRHVWVPQIATLMRLLLLELRAHDSESVCVCVCVGCRFYLSVCAVHHVCFPCMEITHALIPFSSPFSHLHLLVPFPSEKVYFYFYYQSFILLFAYI